MSDTQKTAAEYDVKENSLEMGKDTVLVADESEIGLMDAMAIPSSMVTTKWQRLANKLEASSGAEARGIERVDESMRRGRLGLKDYWHMTTIWFSINLTVGLALML